MFFEYWWDLWPQTTIIRLFFSKRRFHDFFSCILHRFFWIQGDAGFDQLLHEQSLIGSDFNCLMTCLFPCKAIPSSLYPYFSEITVYSCYGVFCRNRCLALLWSNYSFIQTIRIIASPLLCSLHCEVLRWDRVYSLRVTSWMLRCSPNRLSPSYSS